MPELDVVLTPAEIARLPGRDLSRTVAVAFDVLRATSSMVAALANGAARILPAESVAKARRLAREFPGALLAGERRRVRIPGFDLGNSPREFTAESVAGRTIIMATTNGTRAVCACRGAEAAFIASFLNISAAAAEAARFARSGADVLLVCGGTAGHFSLEDGLAAGCMADILSCRLPGLRLGDAALALRRAWLGERRRLPAAVGEGRNGRTLAGLGLAADAAWVCRLDAFGVAPRLRIRRGVLSVR